jgi:hypothetical protein
MSHTLLIFGIIVVISAFAVLFFTLRKPWKPQKKYPHGHWMGVGMAIGMGMGIPLALPVGISMGKIAVGISLGPAFGAALGITFGIILQHKYRHTERALTPKERNEHRIAVIGGGLVLLLGVILFAALLMLR